MTKIGDIYKHFPSYIHRYVWPLPKFRREIVVMVDGVHSHGGLTDRFRNILSIYSYCKTKGIPFRLYYVYPHRLEDILLPASYDWRINERDLSYHVLDSEELVLYYEELPGTGHWNNESARAYNDALHLSKLDECLSVGSRRQIHEYGSAWFAKGSFKVLFEELFKPSDYLQEKIDSVLAYLPQHFDAVTFRFQSLLGDFYEGSFKALSDPEAQDLAQKCLNKLDSMYDDGKFTTGKVLVTSDSTSFLSIASERPYVQIIPGRMEHMDFTSCSDIDVCAKSFVDLFILMRSDNIIQLVTGQMYKSGFPEFAAELGGKPYSVIKF